MPLDQPTPSGAFSSAESKPRGANRSTKVAGKLKVLPEQPEPATSKVVDFRGPPRDEDVGTTGDSDEGDIDDDEEDDPDDVEVSGDISGVLMTRIY